MTATRTFRARLVAALAGVLAGTGLLVGPTTVHATPTHEPVPQRLTLPEPTGRAPVGTSTIHLLDRSRTDPWVPDAGYRQLMVSMFYPAATDEGPPARYMTRAESRAFVDFQREQGVPIPDDVPGGILRTVDTRADRDPAPRQGRRPLVLLSPGFSLSRSSLTGLATELASRGYVVAAIDHTYESAGITLPGGQLAPCAACDVENYGTIAPIRAADVSYVLDRLLGENPAWRHAEVIDRHRIGIAGHSIGGNTAAVAMASDRRIDAGVNMDGTFFTPVRGPFAKPFMLLGDVTNHAPDGEDETWPRDFARLAGPRYWFSVERTGHFSFIDVPVLGEDSATAPTGATATR